MYARHKNPSQYKVNGELLQFWHITYSTRHAETKDVAAYAWFFNSVLFRNIRGQTQNDRPFPAHSLCLFNIYTIAFIV